MNADEKQKVVITIAVIASFLTGSFVTATFTHRSHASSVYAQASIWSRLFGNVQQNEIKEYADVIRLVLDQIEKIHELETRISVLETCGGECERLLPPPDYDSGWHPVLPSAGKEKDLVLHHNLNTLDYLVYFISCEEEPSGSEEFIPTKFHNFGTGGAFLDDYILDRQIASGTYWTAYKNSITIHRYPQDTVSNYVRVMLWTIPRK